jgi:ubiquinone biosynthesis protein
VLEQLETMTREGHMLSSDTIDEMARAEARKARLQTVSLWVIAVALIGIFFAIRGH